MSGGVWACARALAVATTPPRHRRHAHVRSRTVRFGRPVDEKDIPTCTPTGQPLEPMIPLNPDGTVNTDPPKRCNPTQETILHKYGPELVKKLKVKVEQAVENLRAYLGEYRALPPDEAEARKAAQQLKRQAEFDRWKPAVHAEMAAEGEAPPEPAQEVDEDDEDDDYDEELVLEDDPTGVR